MFGDRLKELREDTNMTQDELAYILNVSRATISGYENGVNEPNIDNLIKLAETFNVSLDYLMGRTKLKKSPTEKLENKKLIIDLLNDEHLYYFIEDIVKVYTKHKK